MTAGVAASLHAHALMPVAGRAEAVASSTTPRTMAMTLQRSGHHRGPLIVVLNIHANTLAIEMLGHVHPGM